MSAMVLQGFTYVFYRVPSVPLFQAMQHATIHHGSSDSDAHTDGMDFHGAGEISTFNVVYSGNVADKLIICLDTHMLVTKPPCDG